jgi:excisionase family DNA binding protein
MNAVVPNPTDLLSDKDAAQYLGLAEGTLAVWRCNGRYQIPFIKIGTKVRYRRAQLDAWLESRTQKATL